MSGVIESIRQKVERGAETLFTVDDKRTGDMTLATGCPVSSMKQSMCAGPCGPVLLQDTALLEKLQHFDREKIPPRNVHALGNGAYGTFNVTHDISRYSCAKVFSPGKSTDIFVRFSGIFTELGEADTTRDPRGFAIKFYTGQHPSSDLTLQMKVTGIYSQLILLYSMWYDQVKSPHKSRQRDAKLGPDAIHGFKRDPRTFEWNDEQLWDFVVSHPESWHQTLMIFSDRVGTPMSYRSMHGYGCNTFSLINEHQERFWVKFHMLAQAASEGLTEEEAAMVAGVDPDWLKRDLREAIERGDYPKWRFAVQVMPEEEGYRHGYTFDCTKVWPHDEYPLIDIGTLELNRNPVDYFAEVEQAAFNPAAFVPGIGPSPDKLLQGRMMLYMDTQFHRLGPNYQQLPINAPKCPIATNYFAGQHQTEVIRKWPHYYPSQNGGIQPQEKYRTKPWQTDGTLCDYFDYPLEGTDADYYDQPRCFIETTLNVTERDSMIKNIACSLACVKNQKIVSMVLEQLGLISKTSALKVDEIRSGMINGKVKRSPGCELWQRLRTKLSQKQID